MNSKALFGKESCQRSWLRDWKTFCLHSIFACKFAWQFACKLGYLTKVNPSGSSYKKPPPVACHAPWVQGRLCRWFLGLLFTVENWCKQVVWQPLRRLTPSAPLHSGAKVLLTFGNVILYSTFIYKLYCLKWFSAIKLQAEQTAKLALLVQGRVSA